MWQGVILSSKSPGRFLPKISQDNSTNILNFQEAILMDSMMADSACRGIVIRFLLPLTYLVILFCNQGIHIKTILARFSILPSPSTFSYPTILITTSTILVFVAIIGTFSLSLSHRVIRVSYL